MEGENGELNIGIPKWRRAELNAITFENFKKRFLESYRAQIIQKRNLVATSKLQGVSWHKKKQKWESKIKKQGKAIFLGWFDSETDAAKAYDKASIRLRGR